MMIKVCVYAIALAQYCFAVKRGEGGGGAMFERDQNHLG